MKTVAASMAPILGAAAVSKLNALAEKVVVYPSGINFRIDQPKHLATADGLHRKVESRAVIMQVHFMRQ